MKDPQQELNEVVKFMDTIIGFKRPGFRESAKHLWIQTKFCTPPAGEVVLGWDGDYVLCVMPKSGNDEWFHYSEAESDLRLTTRPVTHWMVIPDSPWCIDE